MDALLIVWILVLAALLILDWRLKWRTIRVVLVLMALLQLWFSQGNLTSAVRSAMLAPPEQRVTTIGGIDSAKLDDYRSGVLTMAEAIERQGDAGALHWTIAVTVLVWLAISPIISRRHAPVATDRDIPGAAA